MPRRALAFLPVLFVALALLPGVLGQSGGPLIATVTGPAALAPAQTASYNITLAGGPTGNVNYSITYYLTGTNTSGAFPLPANPGRASGNKTLQHVNVTAPGTAQTITLTVSVTATEAGGIPENTTTTFPITVVAPVTLTATFHNGGTTVALNVTVRWYIDSVLVGTSLIRQIGANADATVTFNYLPANLAPGQHTVTATADLDHDGTINPARGEVQTSTLFYNQQTPPASGWLALLGIGIFIPVFLGVVAVRRRGQR
jgi:uncharacterized membrane protein